MRPQRRGRIETDPDRQEGKAKPGKGSMVLKDGESGHRREEPGTIVGLPSPRKVPETSPERDGQGEKERAPGPKELTGLRLKDKRKKGMDPAGTEGGRSSSGADRGERRTYDSHGEEYWRGRSSYYSKGKEKGKDKGKGKKGEGKRDAPRGRDRRGDRTRSPAAADRAREDRSASPF